MSYKLLNVHEKVYHHLKLESAESGTPMSTLVAKALGIDIYSHTYEDMKVGELRDWSAKNGDMVAAMKRAQQAGYVFEVVLDINAPLHQLGKVRRIE